MRRRPLLIRIAAVAVLLLVAACNPGVVMDDLDRTTATPRNADLRGRYDAHVYCGEPSGAAPRDLHVSMTLLRDGSFEIAAPDELPPVPEEAKPLADCLRPTRGSWAASRDDRGKWWLELRLRDPDRLFHAFMLSGRRPPYGVYYYLGDPDAGHCLSWQRVAGDEAAGPPTLPAAAEPVTPPVTETMRQEEQTEREGMDKIANVVLGIAAFIVGSIVLVVAAIAFVVVSSVAVAIVAATRSAAAGLRLFAVLWGGASGFVIGAAGFALAAAGPDHVIGRWTSAAIGGVLGAAAGAYGGWIVASLVLRVVDALRATSRGLRTR